jgi:hypothetical protein
MYYAFSALLCVPNALAQPDVVLGNQAGQARIGEIAAGAGFSRFRQAAQTPFNIVLEARPWRRERLMGPKRGRSDGETLMNAGQRRAAVAQGGARVLALPGAALVCEVQGSGPAVVLVHGFGLEMRMWEPQVPALAADFLVVRYDWRGFGSTGPFDSAVPYTHADDLARRLPGAEYRRVGAAGHMVNMEQPETVNDLLIGFLTRLSSG